MKDITNLARTIWGEARGEPRLGREAVAATVMNRVGAGKWFSGTVSQVVLRPYQFSAWLVSDPNRAKMLAADETTPGFLDALEIAALAMDGRLPDPTGGATHYYSKYIPPPNWTIGGTKTAEIGSHIFYKGVA